MIKYNELKISLLTYLIDEILGQIVTYDCITIEVWLVRRKLEIYLFIFDKMTYIISMNSGEASN